MSLDPIVFLLGAPRSGTTLLRVMLEGHPQLFSPPEMVIAPFATMAERKQLLSKRYWEKGGLRRTVIELEGADVDAAKATVESMTDWSIPDVYSWLQERIGDRVLVDKCPHLAANHAALPRLAEWCPDAKWIHLVRNPGSVIRSVQNMNMAEVILDGYGKPNELWYRANKGFVDFLDTVPEDRKLLVRYEDVVTDPEGSMRRMCAWLGLPYEEAMTRPYDGERMREGPKGARAIGDPNMAARGAIDPKLAEKWLDSFDHRTVDAQTKQLALQLGYDLEAIPLPRMTAVSEAMGNLLDTVRSLEQSIEMPAEIDGVEGRRFLLRMLSQSIDTFAEYNDADRPVFHHAEGPTRKMFADCPDTDYLRAPLRTDNGRVYRLSGRVPPGTTYAGVLLYGKGGRIGNRLPDEEMGIGEDGRFEVLISTEPQEGVWLKADGDETSVMVRQYFTRRDQEEPVEVQLELVGEKAPPQPMDTADFARQIYLADRMLQAIFKRTLGALDMARQVALKKFITLDGAALFPTPDNLYQVCWFRVPVSQAMIVRGKLPKARYFSLCLYNAWMESLDYQARTIHLNHGTLKTEPDGSFELILAHEDPGHPNWLDVGGHEAGYLLARSLLPQSGEVELSVEVKYLRELG